MNYFFVTGSSRGLGKSLAAILLEDQNNFVYGLARSSSIQHKNYSHISFDLNDLDAVQAYDFPTLKDADKITLVNNAAVVGDIKHLGNINSSKLISAYNINLVSPAILINSFIKAYRAHKSEKLIVNISSGAGRTPIDGWSIYCSTKSGLDMLSRVLKEEAQIDQSPFTVLSLAPGIIDTEMQLAIRKSDQTHFSAIENFINYKENGELSSPTDTAKQVMKFINHPTIAANVLCSIRELNS